MAITRALNLIGQQRIDLIQLRSIESGVCGDFDTLAGTFIASQAPVVVSGLHVVTTGITQATSLILQTAGSIFINFNATASGSLFHIPDDTPDDILSNSNPNISGNWTASAVNYIGIDIFRAPDITTTDLVEVMDTTTLVEEPIKSPLAVTAMYQIVITTSDFDANPSICPIAKVTLDAGGAITAIQDCRNFMFRLGTGGTLPNNQNTFNWPNSRNEAGSSDPFAGADKSISSQKQFSDALMTRLWELGGGEYWYSPTADRNIRLCHTGSPFIGTGDFFSWDGTNLLWKGLIVLFDNSTANYNLVADQTSPLAGLTDLTSGQCIYVDIDRTTNRAGATSLIPLKGDLSNLGTPQTPGSRWVLAWNYNGNIFVRDQSFAVGTSFAIATVSAAGAVKLSASDFLSPAHVATVDSQSYAAKAAGLTRGYFPGQTTPSVTDFIGGTGDITIGGGYDGADTHGGGNPVDHNVLIQTSRAQDEVRVQGPSNFNTNGASTLSVAALASSNFPQLVLGRFSVQGSATDPTTRNSSLHINADGTIGLVNNEDADPANSGNITAPNPISGALVRGKLGQRTNGLTSPNKRDQLVWVTWDGEVIVLAESNPY